MKRIKTVGIIGAGTMGAAIAQKVAQQGFKTYLNDREQHYLDRGMKSIEDTLQQGVEMGVFKPELKEQTMSNLHPTTDQKELANCDLIIEAVFEDLNVKCKLFEALDSIVGSETILATNTSSFSVSEIATYVSHPERFIGLHYFYHAAKNRLVEIIPGEQTSKETIEAVKMFSIMSGKDPILTKDAYGFAVNRFFVPWLNESVKLLGEGVGSIAQIDTIAMKTFGIGMGPFALMNATGVPIALHAQRTLEVFGPSYRVSERLIQQVDSREDWDLSGMNDCEYTEEQEKIISERLLGCVYFVCSQILEEAVCSPVDLNRGARIGLRWKKGPVDMMIAAGEISVLNYVQNYTDRYGEQLPEGINSGNWTMQYVIVERKNSVGIITMSRPEDLNALNEVVMNQLDDAFTSLDNDPTVKTIVLTGTGKAFVAGADIRFFVSNIRKNTIDNIVDFTAKGHDLFNRIDKSHKKVVALLNGLTLGGGMELALCADVVLALPDVKIAFPETGIGIFPGLGGTQRTAIRVGKGLAKYLILTGVMIGAKDAEEFGLIDGIISYQEMFAILSGEQPIPSTHSKELTGIWKSLSFLYGSSGYKDIISGNSSYKEVPDETLSKISKLMKFKAPVAMDFAEELIEKGCGTRSELDKLHDIFSTDDALLGLSSIGQKVEYSGK